ncbi:hypothetical protein GCM10010464_63540 [Pseudonocardia yunnanensis]
MIGEAVSFQIVIDCLAKLVATNGRGAGGPIFCDELSISRLNGLTAGQSPPSRDPGRACLSGRAETICDQRR